LQVAADFEFRISGRFWSARERFSHWWISTFQMKKGLSLK